MEYAFKKLIEVNCQDFSKLFKELSFNFMFDSDYQPRLNMGETNYSEIDG